MRNNNNRNVIKEIPAGAVTLYGEGRKEDCGSSRVVTAERLLRG